MDIKKIYISGKITGLPVREAIAKFRSAAEKIRRFGFEPVSPFDNGLPLEADWAEHIGKISRCCFDVTPSTCWTITRRARVHASSCASPSIVECRSL